MKLSLSTLLFAALTSLCAMGEPAAAPFIRDLASPATPDSSGSSLTTGPDGTVYLTWCGPGEQPGVHSMWLAALHPAATAWDVPRVVTSTPALMENWADFPSLTVGTDGQLWAQWYQTLPSNMPGYSGWVARSSNGGATWTKPVPLGQEFVRMAPLNGGRVLAVWLRSLHDETEPHRFGRPEMELRAQLLAPDGSTLQDWLVDPDTCSCCQISLASLTGDRAFLAYRGHDSNEIRDNRFAVFTEVGWSQPKKLHEDGWMINACPVNGPAVAARREHISAAWYTAAKGARVQARSSRDGGITFSPPVVVDMGRPLGRLDQVMLADGSAIISWMEAGKGQDAGVFVRRLFPDGVLSDPVLVAQSSSARSSGFPRLAVRHGADLPVVVSWTETGSSSRIRTVEFQAISLQRPTGTPALAAQPEPFLPELCSPATMPATR